MRKLSHTVEFLNVLAKRVDLLTSKRPNPRHDPRAGLDQDAVGERRVTQSLPTTNPTAADDDDDHTIVIPPRTPDDYVVLLHNGERLWVSLPPPVRALLPDGLFIAPTEPTPKLRKPRRPTLASVAKQASKAAIPVACYENKPDGTIVVVTGMPSTNNTDTNPWDEVLTDAADTKRPS